MQISLPGPTRAVALAAGTEDGVWSRCWLGAWSGTIPRSPPIRRRPPLVSIPIRHHLISMSALTAAPPVPARHPPAPPRLQQLRLGTAALPRCLRAWHHQTLANTIQIQTQLQGKTKIQKKVHIEMWRASYIPELQLNGTCWKSTEHIRGKNTLVTI